MDISSIWKGIKKINEIPGSKQAKAFMESVDNLVRSKNLSDVLGVKLKDKMISVLDLTAHKTNLDERKFIEYAQNFAVAKTLKKTFNDIVPVEGFINKLKDNSGKKIGKQIKNSLNNFDNTFKPKFFKEFRNKVETGISKLTEEKIKEVYPRTVLTNLEKKNIRIAATKAANKSSMPSEELNNFVDKYKDAVSKKMYAIDQFRPAQAEKINRKMKETNDLLSKMKDYKPTAFQRFPLATTAGLVGTGTIGGLAIGKGLADYFENKKRKKNEYR